MTLYHHADGISLWHGDALRVSEFLEPESVDLLVTSPPYFALRSYTDGGEHYEGQIGSEATPREFVDALVACTADWCKVLKPGGSIWVNLGDSYAGSGGYNNSAIGADGRGPASYKRAKWGSSKDGARPQWTRESAAWMAALIDGEGSISARQFVTGNSPSFVAWVRVGQMDDQMVKRAHEITGVGRVFQDKRGVWNWAVSAQAARYVLERIWPWLVIKQRQALAAVELCRHIDEFGGRGRWNPLGSDEIGYRSMIVQAVQAWNRRESAEWEPPKLDPIPLPYYESTVKPKSLQGIPWRYALRCIDDLGLILRAEVIWSKPNGLPESVTDRVRRSHENWFHFTRQGRYFAAVDEVREGYAERYLDRVSTYGDRKDIPPAREYAPRDRTDSGKARGILGLFTGLNPLGKLPGSVWTIPSEPLTVPAELGVDHFAAFPTEWPRRIILGWSPSGVCVECGEGRRPVVEYGEDYAKLRGPGTDWNRDRNRADGAGDRRSTEGRPTADRRLTGYACACPDPTAPTRPAVVLDPFGGTGTTALVARALGRHAHHVDLSRDYLKLAQWRIWNDDNAYRKASERSGIKVPEPPKIDGQLDLLDGVA